MISWPMCYRCDGTTPDSDMKTKNENEEPGAKLQSRATRAMISGLLPEPLDNWDLRGTCMAQTLVWERSGFPFTGQCTSTGEGEVCSVGMEATSIMLGLSESCN